MSELKATPGPWSLVEHASEGEAEILIRRQWDADFTPGSTGSATYGSCLGAHIADIKHQGSDAPVVTREQAMANAHLIAAAPELYAELQETHAALCMKDPDYLGSERHKRNAAALDKARGE